MVWAQMIATWTLMEAANQDQFKAPWGTNSDSGKPSPAEFKGDFRNGFLDFGWDSQTDAWKKSKRAIELNNGRAAQMGILGLMVHDKLGNIDVLLPSP
jgi:Chlorophyll A-B binding protein